MRGERKVYFYSGIAAGLLLLVWGFGIMEMIGFWIMLYIVFQIFYQMPRRAYLKRRRTFRQKGNS